MKRLLIVAPHFPPVSAPDGQRARLSVRHFAEFGWEPFVLTVDPAAQRDVQDPALAATLPPGLSITTVAALPERWTRLAGLGNVALRAWPYLCREGRRLIARHEIDLVYFSTTMVAAMPLGRIWKRRCGVPFVLDIQDPWYPEPAARQRGAKARLATWMHGVLEPFTLRSADGLIAVSEAYITTLRRRYPWIEADACAVIPFGASSADFTAARALAWTNPFFRPGAGRLHAVSIGRGGADVRTAARIFFRALRLLEGRHGADRPWAPLDVHLVGTDYAPSGQGRQTLQPVAEEEGIGRAVTESPARVPYLEGLRLMGDADVVVVLGSDDPQYSPSKVYPSLLSGRPVVSILHEGSPAVELMQRADAGPVVTFASEADVPGAAAALAGAWPELMGSLGRARTLPDAIARQFSARELTRRQCDVFDRVVGMRHAATEEAVCRG
jgi:glycosyltransferase involved in cell wall biosynthesis